MSHLKSAVYQNITTNLHKVYDKLTAMIFNSRMSKEYDPSGSQTGKFMCNILAVMTHVHVNEKSKGSVIKHIKAELHLITFK
jgi:hypothetical protein